QNEVGDPLLRFAQGVAVFLDPADGVVLFQAAVLSPCFSALGYSRKYRNLTTGDRRSAVHAAATRTSIDRSTRLSFPRQHRRDSRRGLERAGPGRRPIHAP